MSVAEATITTVTPAAIAEALAEPNIELMGTVVKVLGTTRAQAFLQEALAIEAAGGMMTEDRSRRRTPGGVFFALLKRGVSARERRQIFGDQIQAPAQPSSPAVCTWAELGETIAAMASETGEEAHVKLTLIGRPSTMQTRGQTVVFQLTGKPPTHLPKGLPPMPKTPPIVWSVVVGLRQWNRVKDSLRTHPEDKLVIEGYPCLNGDHHLLLANGCTSIMMQKARKEAQQAALKEATGGAESADGTA